MRRVTLLLIVVGLAMASSPLAAVAQSRGKAKKKSDARVLKVGDEVSLFIVGDEATANPNLGRAGVVSADALVLPVFLKPNGRSVGVSVPSGIRDTTNSSDPVEEFQYDQDERTARLFREAADTSDRAGITRLLAEDRAAKVPVGTRLVVLSRLQNMKVSSSGLSSVPGGDCRARILSGPSASKIVEIPVRNLR